MWWTEWWIWGAAAMVLVILEVLLPSYLFLGFGIGAGVMGLGLWVGGPLSGFFNGSFAWTMAAFAVVSLISWITLRLALGVTKTQVKTFDEDINDH